MTGCDQQTITRREGTDAALTLYHADQGKRFVREHSGRYPRIDTKRLAIYLELTSFSLSRRGMLTRHKHACVNREKE